MENKDRSVLCTFFESTGGPLWKISDGWLSDRPLREWHGVTVNEANRVTELSLASNNLAGCMSKELGGLAELETLDLFQNDLSGEIPSQLGQLRRLTKLVLSRNKLEGAIPPEIGQLNFLEELDVASNRLSGPIPPELVNLVALKTMDLSLNSIKGRIPSKIGLLQNLEILNLSHNHLEGTIPAELAQLQRLSELKAEHNRLAGPIPPELGQLRLLRVLDLAANPLLACDIPPELGQLDALEVLNLCYCSLRGSIPVELCNLKSLSDFQLKNNFLTGVIPPELGKLQALTHLALEFNRLSGRIPPELCRIRGLINLYLNDNKLDGCIPPELGDLNELLILHLHNNELHGVIPSQLCKMRNLEELGLRDNNLTGLWDHTQDAEQGMNLHTRAGPRSLPEELDRLLNWLSTLQQDHLEWCEGNSWKEPPDAIVHAGLAKVRDYLKDFFAGSCTVRRANVKVVIVGQQTAGKTSLRQSIKEKRPAPTAGLQDSTVQIDVEKDVDLNGVCVNFYDCAGQVAYTGLLQMFLTRRSVAIIVCDAGAFGQREASLDYDAQLDRDVRQLESLRVCDWLRFLSFRIPDSDAILVATKCDLAAGVAPDTAARIERASNRWLRTLANDGMRAVHVEPGVSLTSCVERKERITFFGRALHLIYSLWKVVWSAEPARENLWPCDWREGCSEETRPSLLQRIVRKSDGHGLRGAEMVLPHSWDIALRVLDALRCGRDPAVVVERHLIAMNGSKVFEETSVERTKKEYTGITTQELDEVWMDVLRTLSDKNLEVASADHALEGALTIREFEGTLLRHESYVFLDVHWLTTILKPIQNHKDVTTFEGNVSLGDMGDTSLITLTDQKDVWAWERLKNKGILEPKLAKTIWPRLSDYVLPTLESLGLTFPLARDPAGGLVVLLKLPAERPVTVGKDLEKFRNIHKEIFTASWTFYMGTPPGAIEKVLTRCASIGAIQTFWRFGVLVQGDLSTEGVQGKYVLLVEYDNDKRVLELKVYGKVVTAGPWAALSFGLSAVRTMCKEFPGLRRRSSFTCPEPDHDNEVMLMNENARRWGHKLLDAAAPCPRCSPETGGLGVVARELLEMVDTSKSRVDVFNQVNNRFVHFQEIFSDLRPEGDSENPAEVTDEGGAQDSNVTKDLADMRHMLATMQRQIDNNGQILSEEFEVLQALLVESKNVTSGKLDSLMKEIMELRAVTMGTPTRACVLPPWDFALPRGLTKEEQALGTWKKRLNEWREDDFKEGKEYIMKRKRLFFICAKTGHLVPCGHKGQGYIIDSARTWFRAAVSLTAFAFQVVSAVLGGIALAQLSGNTVGALAEEAIGAGVENVSTGVDATLGEMVDDKRGTDLEVLPQGQELTGEVYRCLQKLVHEMELRAKKEIHSNARKTRKPWKQNQNKGPKGAEFVFFEDVMEQVRVYDKDETLQWVLK